MTEREQKMAIAEACGWESVENADGDLTEPHLTRIWNEWLGPNGQQDLDPPEYCHDLNAMHEAEKSLSDFRGAMPQRWFDAMIRFASTNNPSGMRSTAPQRAEAFLRTIGKWKD